MILTTIYTCEWLSKFLIQLLHDLQHLCITIPYARSPRHSYINRLYTKLKISPLSLQSVFQYPPVTYSGLSHYLISLLSVKCVLIFILPLCILNTRTLRKMNEHLNHSLGTIQSWNLKFIMTLPLAHCFWHTSSFEFVCLCF